ncbi:MAG: carboxypeptidase regulatory-like domain-containing protein [Anaeromyxobacter sp.]
MSRRRAALLASVASLVALLLLGAALLRRAPAPATAPAPPLAGAAAAAPAATPPPPPPSGLPIRLPAAPPAPADDAPGTFEGRVVSSGSGAGIGGAELTFSRAGAAATVRTGPDGAFLFQPPAEGRWLLASATAPGHFPFAPEWGHSPVQLDAARGRHVRGIELQLAPEVALEGRVLDGDGQPVAGAEVRLLGAAAEAALVRIPDRFTSDAAGAFRFAAPEGTVVEARKAGFLPAREAVTPLVLVNGKLELWLEPRRGPPPGPAAAVTGQVVARGGQPLAEALVVAQGQRGFGLTDAPAAQALTGEDGRFRLELEPGRYRLTARAEGYAQASANGVTPGGPEVVLTLDDGGRLAGCVRDASGGPVTPFTVLVFERRSALRLVEQRSRSVIDPAGCFALDDLTPGPASVVVSAPGRAPSDALRVEIPPPPGEARLDVALEAGGVLTGVVRDDATSAPLAGARLSVEGDLAAASTFPVLSEAVTGPDGRFTLTGLPRRVSVYAAAAGHHARILGGVDVPPGAPVGPVELRLRPTAPGEAPRVDLAGIGIVIAPHGDTLGVASVVAGGGAAEVGLQPGDLIVEVNGQRVDDLGMTAAVDAIRGPEGTFVLLSVRRGDRTLEFRVPRRIVRG